MVDKPNIAASDQLGDLAERVRQLETSDLAQNVQIKRLQEDVEAIKQLLQGTLGPPQVPILIMDGSVVIAGDPMMELVTGTDGILEYRDPFGKRNPILTGVDIFLENEDNTTVPVKNWARSGTEFVIRLQGNSGLQVTYQTDGRQIRIVPVNFHNSFFAPQKNVRYRRNMRIQQVSLPDPNGGDVNNGAGPNQTFVVSLNILLG